jgi:hypothetical protein
MQSPDLHERSAALNDAPALREAMAHDGYLFFRDLLPIEDVLATRAAVLACCADGGWLRSGSDVAAGIADVRRATVEPEPSYNAVYFQVQRQRAFHALAYHPALQSTLAHITGAPLLTHPLKIARLMFPQNEAHTTRAHHDYPFIQGTPETFTAWIPLGDCPRALGGLEINPGTHRDNRYVYHPSLGAGAMSIQAEDLPPTWLSADYRAGDVLLFHSRTVHRALPNRDPERLRLSVDYRYQNALQPVCTVSLQPHMGELTWDDVYAAWGDDSLCYEWRRFDLQVTAYDRSAIEQRDREAFELAARGDPVARPALLRIAQRDADPQRRERARLALAALPNGGAA